MTTFTLPDGYTLGADEGGMILSDIPQVQEYGGATITEKWDAIGVHFVAICCKNPAGLFRFRVFREDAPEQWRELPIEGDCDGRGSITKNDFDGTLRWRAWKGNQFFGGVIPEAVAFAGAGGAPTRPADLVQVWAPEYRDDKEVLGDGKLHVRLNKLKAGLRQIQEALGWLG